MIKRLLQCVREYKRATILTPIFVSLEVVLECSIPYMIANLVNSFNDNVTFAQIARSGGWLVLMAIGSLTFGVLSGFECANASCGLGKNLRKDLFYAISDYSFDNIDKFSTSSLVTRMTTDVMNVQNAFMMIIRIAVRAPFMLIFAFVMAFMMAGKLAWIFAVVVPILAAGLIIIAKLAIPLFRRIFKKYDKLNESVEENIRGMRVVKSFVRGDFEEQKFDAASEEVRADFTKAERILAFNGPLMQFCLYVVMVFTLSVGSYFVITTRGMAFDVGQISAMLTYSWMILNSLMMISMIFVMITMASESAKRIVEVLTEKSLIVSPENPVTSVADGSIDFDNVTFAYAGNAAHDVLSGIDLHIKSGETIGIIGATGSAKSSLVQLIPRLYDVTGGEVKVGGVNVKDYDLNVLRNEVSVVLQKNVLFSGTIIENLRWGNPNATIDEIKEACALACAHEFIDTFPDGYETHIEQGGSNVSGGQKQRLCIARALLKRPKIIIFDDSTSAVDTWTDAMIRQGMKKFIPATTKIIIAQRTASVEDADRIVVLDDGKIASVGTHEELLATNEIYRDIYISQNKASKGEAEVMNSTEGKDSDGDMNSAGAVDITSEGGESDGR